MLGEPASRDDRDIARHAGRMMRLRDGETLIRQGNEGRDAFVVLPGDVQLAARGNLIETARPGDGLPPSGTARWRRSISAASASASKARQGS